MIASKVVPTCLIVLLTAGCLDAAPANGPDGIATAPPELGSYTVYTACFEITVQAPRLPEAPDALATLSYPVTMTGTLFLPDEMEPVPRLILLVPGGASTRSFLDGGDKGYGREDGTTLPRTLARHGYAVVVLERLGMPESPYPGPGTDINLETNLAAMTAVVQQLKSGSYTMGDDSLRCPGGERADLRFPNIVVGGHSLGGFYGMHYGLEGGPADGFLFLAYHLGDFNPEATAWISNCAAQTIGERIGYARVLCHVEQPHPGCAAMLLLDGVIDPSAADAMCAQLDRTYDAAGEADLFLGAAFEIRPHPSATRAPTLFVFAAADRMIRGEPDSQGRDTKVRTRDFWSEQCGCATEILELDDAAHNFMFQTNRAQHFDATFRALVDLGLGPEVTQ